MTGHLCPAATGIPVDSRRCLVGGAEHHCMRDALPGHPLHVCHCGAQWASSTDLARTLPLR